MPDKKILYHGTGKTIGEFNRHTYFATDPKISDRYATYRRGEAPQMYRVEAKLKNPAYMDDFRKSKQELGEDAINEDVFSHLESKGFDHFLPYGKNSKEIVIFDPNKSTLPKFEDGGKVDNDGITAYHGSPHDFEQFDVSKIGSGEGAQAFGHGLYFAENEDVAKGYRDRLAGHIPGAVQIGDEKHPHWARHNVAKAFSKLGYDPQTSVIAAHLIDEAKGDLNKAGSDVWENANIPDSVHEALLRAEFAEPAGKMYEVHIKAHPEHFLDWDKPIKEHSQELQNAIAQTLDYAKKQAKTPEQRFSWGSVFKRPDEFLDYTGSSIQNLLSRNLGLKGASDALAMHGVKGIKYLDQGSRGTGHGSRNYVVFDDKLVNVNRKYEDGGAVN